MLHKVKQDCTRFPNNKVIAFMIDQSRNTAIGIDLGVFCRRTVSKVVNCQGDDSVPGPLCSPFEKSR